MLEEYYVVGNMSRMTVAILRADVGAEQSSS